jgi:hypothetical protein
MVLLPQYSGDSSARNNAKQEATVHSKNIARLVSRSLIWNAVLCAISAGIDLDARAAALPTMAPLAQYLMSDANVEVALARSAAPPSISAKATVLVLTQRGYEKAVAGTNGFVCIVERSWMSPADSDEFWNPKMRGPICFNPPAVRSILPITYRRTELALSGTPKLQLLGTMTNAVDKKELPAPEPGAMSYMMSKEGYLGDTVGHWHPHLMFYGASSAGPDWGADQSGSPVVMSTQFPTRPDLLTIFMIQVPRWSDGTLASAMKSPHDMPNTTTAK